METKTPIDFRFDSFTLLNFLIKKRAVLFITGLAAAIISAAVSFIAKPEYKSVAIIFPSPNVLETQSLLNTQNASTDFFGGEIATEMVLQIIQSDKINDYLINKFQLFNHYLINDSNKKNTLLEKKMKKNITSRKTQFNSIEITVFDTDPSIAAEIANEITWQVDSVFNLMRKETAAKSLKLISELYNDQLYRVKAIEDSLSMPQIGRSGSSGSSYTFFNKAVIPFLSSGNSTGEINTISKFLDGVTYTPEYIRLINAFFLETENLSVIQGKLLETRTLANQDLPYVYIIKTAKVPEIKATPKRTLIVVSSVFSTVLLMIILLLILDPVVRNEK